MFTFRCPACGKLHTAAREFAGPFEARCLRCGDTIEVTAELAHASQTAVQPTSAVPATGHAEGRLPLADDATLPLVEDAEAAPPGPAGKPKKNRTLERRRGPAADEEPSERRSVNYGRGESYRGEEEEDDDPPGPYPAPAPPELAEVADPRPWYQRAPVLIGIAAAVVLLAGGAGAAYYLAAGKARPTKKEVAKVTKPARKATAPAKSTAKAPEPKPAAVEAPKPPPRPDAYLSAPRLAAELAANPSLTDLKYKDKLLEVSGLFDGTGTRSKPGGKHAFFRADGAQVSAEWPASPTAAKAWQALVPGEPMTLRGTYEAAGVLRRTELVPLTAPAEAVYRGKEVELVGYVDAAQPAEDSPSAFPTVRLEPETFSPLDVECLFRKSDEAEIKKVPPGALVTIRGTCSGRRRGENRYHVRLDNCQFVYTTAPTPPAPRLDVAEFLRQYGEDLRRDLLPPAGSEPRLEAPLTVTQVAREFTADRQSVEKYRGKILTVWGRLQGRSRDGGLLLEGDDTDKLFRVSCRFSARNLRLVGGGPILRVRGLCTGLSDGATLHLENCEPSDPEARDTRRLTADFLPHVPGRVLTYDVAVWPAEGGKPVVVRQTFAEGEGGLIETVTTHKGTLAGRSLFDPGEQARWVAQPRTRKVRLPGPVYQRRLSGNLIELGQRVLTKDRQIETVWEPVLKVGARLGESWTWAYGDADHTYTLKKFVEHQGRPAAVVTERVVLNGDDAHAVWVRHVYVRDLGEVERQAAQQLTRTERKVTAEKKLVEGAGPPASRAKGG